MEPHWFQRVREHGEIGWTVRVVYKQENSAHTRYHKTSVYTFLQLPKIYKNSFRLFGHRYTITLLRRLLPCQ